MDYFVGLDVSLWTVAVCVMDASGKHVFKRVAACEIEDIVNCLRFMAIPGVGPIAALTVRAAVDDPARFSSSRTVAAHFGLTPRRYQSGEMDNPGRISRAGDCDVRSTLYAAANAMMMRSVASSEIKSWGLRLMCRKGRRRAVVAVDRKLAVVMHRMWADNIEFRHKPLEAATIRLPSKVQ